MQKQEIISDLKKRMDGALNALDHDLKGLRTGRASVNFLDSVIVEAYNDKMHLSQLATITVPEARVINVQVWDLALVKAVEKAISVADLGISPITNGNIIKVNLPLLSEQRRLELIKIAGKNAEKAKIAIRNVRRDKIEQLKKLEKGGELAKDELHVVNENIQKITDEYIKKIDNIVIVKEKDIMNN